MAIVKVSELISKPLICLDTAELIGTVGNIAFDSKLTKGKLLKVYNDENESDACVSFVEVRKLKSATADACTVADRSSLLREWDLGVKDYNNPMNCECYNQDGKRLGCVRDVVLDGVKVTAVVVDKKEFAPSALLSFSDRLLIFNDTDKPIKLPRKKPVKIPSLSDNARPVKIHSPATINPGATIPQNKINFNPSAVVTTAPSYDTFNDNDSAKNNSINKDASVYSDEGIITDINVSLNQNASADSSNQLQGNPITAKPKPTKATAKKLRQSHGEITFFASATDTETDTSPRMAKGLSVDESDSNNYTTENISSTNLDNTDNLSAAFEPTVSEKGNFEQTIQSDFTQSESVPVVPTAAKATASLPNPSPTVLPIPTTAVPAPRIVEDYDNNTLAKDNVTVSYNESAVSYNNISSNADKETVNDSEKAVNESADSPHTGITLPYNLSAERVDFTSNPKTVSNAQAYTYTAPTQTPDTSAQDNHEPTGVTLPYKSFSNERQTSNINESVQDISEIPTGITLPHKMPPLGRVTPNPSESAQTPYNFLIGKTIKGDLLNADGSVLVLNNTVITADIINAVKAAGKLVQLALHAD